MFVSMIFFPNKKQTQFQFLVPAGMLESSGIMRMVTRMPEPWGMMTGMSEPSGMMRMMTWMLEPIKYDDRDARAIRSDGRDVRDIRDDGRDARAIRDNDRDARTIRNDNMDVRAIRDAGVNQRWWQGCQSHQGWWQGCQSHQGWWQESRSQSRIMTGMPEPSGDGRDAIVIRNDENDGRHPRAISDSDDRDAGANQF